MRRANQPDPECVRGVQAHAGGPARHAARDGRPDAELRGTGEDRRRGSRAVYRLEHETNNITLAAGYGENHKCYNCGGDHKSWECSKKCTICGTNFCGAPKGEPDKCPCDNKEMPPNDQVKNYNGKPIPEKL